MNVYLCFVVCLHFSIGCYYRLQCFWILEQCPVPPSSDLSCSASALMLRSQTTSSRFSDSLKWAPALPGLHLESKTYFELIDTFGHVPCFSAGAPFVVQAFVLCPLRNSGGARIALVRFALKSAEDGPPRAGRLSKTFPEVPRAFSVSSSNRESRRRLWDSESSMVGWERGTLQSCSLSPGS